jgi:DNA-binding MarR family transcriptional regulator
MEEGVGHLIRRVTLSLANDCERRVSVHGLTGTQCAALLQLQRGGLATVGELARALSVNPGAMTRMLDRLERKKLIVRSRNSGDRRVVHIELTVTGVAVVADTRAAPADALDAHLAGFAQAEYQALKSFLARMLLNGEGVRRGCGEGLEGQGMAPGR